MACCGSADFDPEALEGAEREEYYREMKLSEELDAGIERQRLADEKLMKVLILGSGESGKTTILKQMKILHKGGFPEKDIIEYREQLRYNTWECMRNLLIACDFFSIKIEPEVVSAARQILECKTGLYTDTPLEVKDAVKTLWPAKSIQSAYDRRSEFQLIDSAAFLFTNVDRIFAQGFRPTHEDVLRARRPTTGITVTKFELEGYIYQIFDVGGQRGERRKWIRAFEGVRAIWWVASLNEYDKVLAEDPNRNRLNDSLSLFHAIINLPWFRNTPVVLFLNKHDLFQEKVKYVDLGIFDARYTGGCDGRAALDYIRDSYFSMAEDEDRKNTIYCHVTSALDTERIEFVWKATKHMILSDNLRIAGLLQ